MSQKPKYRRLFLDDWPMPPSAYNSELEEEFDKERHIRLQRAWMQTLLAQSPYGIPSLAFCDTYKEWFGRELDCKAFGYNAFADLVFGMPDIFTVQEPDDITACMFPEYAGDYVLHDVRIKHNFYPVEESKTDNTSSLITLAWLNRDDDFPPDAVLPGEQYMEHMLPLEPTNIPGTRGIHKAIIVGAATPNRLYINIKNQDWPETQQISAQVAHYFKNECKDWSNYMIAEEFLYPGFPCLVYLQKEQCWERCLIVERIRGTVKVRIETVDIGDYHTVERVDLFLMPRKFLDIPKQGTMVSLLGLKPNGPDDTWNKKCGPRLRDFSEKNYWLDVLLVRPRDDVALKPKKSFNNITKVKNKDKKPEHEVLICDRYDKYLDLHLDQIMVMEGLAKIDETRAAEIEGLRQNFIQVLKTIPRSSELPDEQ